MQGESSMNKEDCISDDSNICMYVMYKLLIKLSTVPPFLITFLLFTPVTTNPTFISYLLTNGVT